MLITIRNLTPNSLSTSVGIVLPHATVEFDVTEAQYSQCIDSLLELETAGMIALTSVNTRVSKHALINGEPSGGAGGVSIFGPGNDGDVVLENQAFPTGHKAFNNLTIRGTVTFNANRPIKVRGTLTIDPSATLDCNGPSATDFGGAGYITDPLDPIFYNMTSVIKGRTGANAGSGPSNGQPGTNVTTRNWCTTGVTGGAGGAGGNSTGFTGGGGGTDIGGRVGNFIGLFPYPIPGGNYSDSSTTFSGASMGGMGGGSGGVESGATGGAGGGGGCAGGIAHILAKNIVNNGTISCNGGNGADGTAGITDAGGGGGGGGGSGGLIYLVTESYTGSGSLSVSGGIGGSGGAGTGTGTIGTGGSAGTTGTTIVHDISTDAYTIVTP